MYSVTHVSSYVIPGTGVPQESVPTPHYIHVPFIIRTTLTIHSIMYCLDYFIIVVDGFKILV